MNGSSVKRDVTDNMSSEASAPELDLAEWYLIAQIRDHLKRLRTSVKDGARVLNTASSDLERAIRGDQHGYGLEDLEGFVRRLSLIKR